MGLRVYNTNLPLRLGYHTADITFLRQDKYNRNKKSVDGLNLLLGPQCHAIELSEGAMGLRPQFRN